MESGSRFGAKPLEGLGDNEEDFELDTKQKIGRSLFELRKK